MTTGFRRMRDGRLSVRLSEDELALLRQLASEMLDLLADEPRPGEPRPGEQGGRDELEDMLDIRGSAAPPDDPALARLFPDAYRESPQDAGEFRRYTEGGLREAKREAAALLLSSTSRGSHLVLDQKEAEVWLRAVNDVRLALGTRLGVGEEAHEELAAMDPSDPRYPGYAAYDWLSFLLETLVRALW